MDYIKWDGFNVLEGCIVSWEKVVGRIRMPRPASLLNWEAWAAGSRRKKIAGKPYYAAGFAVAAGFRYHF